METWLYKHEPTVLVCCKPEYMLMNMYLEKNTLRVSLVSIWIMIELNYRTYTHNCLDYFPKCYKKEIQSLSIL